MRHAVRLAVLAALLPAGVAGAATLIHAGRLIDGVGEAPREHVTVVVDGGRIRAVESGFTAPGSGDEVVDLSGATVLPGFMDMHVHLTSEHSRTSELDSLKKGESDRAYDSVVYAERTLLAGFTDRAQPRRRVEHLHRPQARDRRGQGQGPARLHRRALDRHARRPRGRDQFLRSFPHAATIRASTPCVTAPTAAARRCASATRTAPTRSRSPQPAACSRSRSPAAPRSSPTPSSRP